MQAQRKPVDPALAAPQEDTAVTPLAREVWHSSIDDDLPTSPAILLQRQIAARLADVEASTMEARDAVGGGAKWPMPLRIATIVGLSLALWGGIFATTIRFIT